MKRRILRRGAAAILLLLCLLTLLPVRAHALQMNIRVGVKGKTPPYQFIDSSGNVTGLNVDIMELIAEKENMVVEYVPYETSEQATEALLKGEVDALLGVTPQKCPEGAVLTNEISAGTVALIVPDALVEDVTARGPSAPRYTVAFEFDTLQFSQISQLRTQYTVVAGDQVQLFRSMLYGNVGAAAAVKESFLYQLKEVNARAEGFTVVNNSMGSVEYRIMVRHNDTMLCQRLNRGISQLRNTSEYDEVTLRWITDENLEAAHRRIQKLIIVITAILLAAALALLLFNAWNRRLKQLVQEQTEEIRQQMRRLEQSRILQDLLIRHFPNSILLLQQDGTVRLMNPRAEKVAGIGNIQWQEPHEPVKLEELPIFRQVWDATAEQSAEEMVSSQVIPITDGDKKRQYRYQYYKLNDQGDSALLLEDVTQEEIQRNAVYEANKNETLNRLIAGIAHEIKNPLMSIQAFASIIREQGHDEDFQESFAQYVPQEVGRINRLIESLINYAKPVNGTRERVDVQRLTNECVYLVSASIKTKRISFSCRNEITAYIQVNRDQIKQALLNLLINSLESVEERIRSDTEAHPTIVVSVTREQEKIALTVRDEGMGMSEEAIRNCFEPFYTTKKTGTGMGMSLAKQFVTENGGEFRLASELNAYTEITMLFKEDTEQ